MDDYYEPWTYDYETLIHSSAATISRLRPRSLVTGERYGDSSGARTGRMTSANGESARQDINLKKMAADITLEFHDLFMKYLPRIVATTA